MGIFAAGLPMPATLSHFNQEYAEASDAWLGTENMRRNYLLTGRPRNSLSGVWDTSLLGLK